MIAGRDMYESIPQRIWSADYTLNCEIPNKSSFSLDKGAANTRIYVNMLNAPASIFGTFLLNGKFWDLDIMCKNGVPIYKADLFDITMDMKDVTDPLERAGNCGVARDLDRSMDSFIKLNKDLLYPNGKVISWDDYKTLNNLKFPNINLFIQGVTSAAINMNGKDPQPLSCLLCALSLFGLLGGCIWVGMWTFGWVCMGWHVGFWVGVYGLACGLLRGSVWVVIDICGCV